MAKLTEKQEIFCREYVVDFNATRAAKAAGYSEKTAGTMGGENLQKPAIQSFIATIVKKRMDKINIDAEYVLKRLVEIDQMDVSDILDEAGSVKPIASWPKVWRTTLSAIDVTEIGSGEENAVAVLKKIKWPDKVRNLELLGKHINVRAWEKEEAGGSDALAESVSKLIDKLPN